MSEQRMQSGNLLNAKAFLITVFLLAFALVIGNFAEFSRTGRVTGFQKGDANTDGKIDQSDLALFLELKKTGVLPQEANTQCSDLTGDGVLDENDYNDFLTKVFVGEQNLGSC